MGASRTALSCIAAAAALASAAQAADSGYRVIDRIAGPDGGWDYVSYDAGRDRVLIARTGAVTAIGLKSRTVNPTFALAAKGRAAFAINGGVEVAITNAASNTVAFVDATSGAVTATVAAGEGPDDAVVDPSSGLLLAINHRGGTITLIDPRTHGAIGTIQVGGVLEGAAVDGAGRAFVNVGDANQIAVIDIAARTVAARYALPGCDGPTGIAYVPGDRLLISSCDGLAEVVRADTGEIVRRIEIGEGADGVAYDARRRLAFIPAGASGTLSVIRVAHGDAVLIDTVPTQIGARTLALDEATGRLFLPTAKYESAKAGERPTPVPGTFELLVVGK